MKIFKKKKKQTRIILVEEDYRARDTWEYTHEWIKKFGRLPLDEDELICCIDYVAMRYPKYKQLQWTGLNLKEVVDFTGKSPKFDEWFKSWEEFENYVHSHNNIFKIFNEDGSHYEVPVGAWIVRTPDGYNVPSKFTFKQKPVEWTEEEQRILKKIHTDNAEGYNWLISLSNPQTRQWKHIDEEVYVKEPVIAQKKNKTDMFGGYVLCADHILNPKTYERYIKVDDIVIQPHWKPTEEQMKALETAVKRFEPSSIIDDPELLETLYNDLKKL